MLAKDRAARFASAAAVAAALRPFAAGADLAALSPALPRAPRCRPEPPAGGAGLGLFSVALASFLSRPG
jgi:hypothetical protein